MLAETVTSGPAPRARTTTMKERRPASAVPADNTPPTVRPLPAAGDISMPRKTPDSGNYDFAAKLRELMARRRLNASDLARQVWGEIKDQRGYMVARNRDRIGHYLSGVSFPEEANLRKLADVLGVSYEDLIMTKPVTGPVSRALLPGQNNNRNADTSLLILNNEPGWAVLSFRQKLPLAVALKIIELIKDVRDETAGTDDPADPD